MASKKMGKTPAEILAEDSDKPKSEFEPDEEFPALDELEWEMPEEHSGRDPEISDSR